MSDQTFCTGTPHLYNSSNFPCEFFPVSDQTLGILVGILHNIPSIHTRKVFPGSDQTFCPSKPHLHISSKIPCRFLAFSDHSHHFLPLPEISNGLIPSWKSHYFQLGSLRIFPEYSDGNDSIGRGGHPCQTTTI